MIDPSDVNKKAAMDTAVKILGEQFDHVQILVTWNEQNACERLFEGCGNWYARQGMEHEFIKCDEAQTSAHAIAEVMPHPEGGEENWQQ